MSTKIPAQDLFRIYHEEDGESCLRTDLGSIIQTLSKESHERIDGDHLAGQLDDLVIRDREVMDGTSWTRFIRDPPQDAEWFSPVSTATEVFGKRYTGVIDRVSEQSQGPAKRMVLKALSEIASRLDLWKGVVLKKQERLDHSAQSGRNASELHIRRFEKSIDSVVKQAKALGIIEADPSGVEEQGVGSSRREETTYEPRTLYNPYADEEKVRHDAAPELAYTYHSGGRSRQVPEESTEEPADDRGAGPEDQLDQDSPRDASTSVISRWFHELPVDIEGLDPVGMPPESKMATADPGVNVKPWARVVEESGTTTATTTKQWGSRAASLEASITGPRTLSKKGQKQVKKPEVIANIAPPSWGAGSWASVVGDSTSASVPKTKAKPSTGTEEERPTQISKMDAAITASTVLYTAADGSSKAMSKEEAEKLDAALAQQLLEWDTVTTSTGTKPPSSTNASSAQESGAAWQTVDGKKKEKKKKKKQGTGTTGRPSVVGADYVDNSSVGLKGGLSRR